MAIQTDCQTPEADYMISITPEAISCEVTFPRSLHLSREQAVLLENNIHNAMELVLARYFEDI